MQVRDCRAQAHVEAEEDGFEVVEGWGRARSASRDEKKKPQRIFSETISRGSRSVYAASLCTRAYVSHATRSNFKDELDLIRQARIEADSATVAILEDEEEDCEARVGSGVTVDIAVQPHYVM